MKVNAKASIDVSSAWSCSLAIGALTAVASAQGTVTRESLDSNGVQADAASGALAVTDDGRFVVFESKASLVPEDAGTYDDIYMRDRSLGTTTLVSRSSSGEHGDRRSLRPCVSADGRYVAFTSWATNFGAISVLPFPENVFVRDLVLGTTTPVTTAPSNSDLAALSADGRFVAFQSPNWPGGAWGGDHVYVRDSSTGHVELVSLTSAGTPANGDNTRPAISADGRFVAFQSNGSNLAPGDLNAVADIYVRDRQAGITLLASVTQSGTGTGSMGSLYPAISADGRWVAFYSYAPEIVVGTGDWPNVFVRDLQLGTTIVASRMIDGSPSGRAYPYKWAPSISSDGRFVAFRSDDALPTDTNHHLDVVLYDGLADSTSVISQSSTGTQSDSDSGGFIAMTRDARVVAFTSRATNLVAGDTNGVEDAFVREVVPLWGATFCTSGVTSNGCVPAISALGIPSGSAGSGYTIHVSGVDGGRSGMLFYGLDNSGFVPSPWGASSSYLCIKAPVQRTAVQDSGGRANSCNGAYVLAWNAYVASNPTALGNPFGGGLHVFAQAWLRDPLSPKTTSLSNALEFVVAP